MKPFTDIEQSKKLSEILAIESADAWWAERYEGKVTNDGQYIVNEEPFYYISFIKPSEINYSQDTVKDIPCWSLTALLDVFPCSKESPIVNLTRGGWNPSFTRRWFATWEDENKNIFYSGDGITPVDAVVELILRLKNSKKISAYETTR